MDTISRWIWQTFYPIKEFNIKPGEALFIDDNEEILDVAYERGFDVKIMMRDTLCKSKYQSITSLRELLDSWEEYEKESFK